MQDIFLKAIIAAHKASVEIKRIYASSGFEVQIKNDGSPITLADHHSNSIISQALSTTDYPIISEESEMPSFSQRRQWEYYWLIDPLDGTKEFINRNDEFTVNIALIKNANPFWGIIAAPALEIMYFSTPEKKAYKLDGFNFFYNYPIDFNQLIANSRQIFSSPTQDNNSKTLASKSHFNKQNIDLIQPLTDGYNDTDIMYMGSSLKFGILAEGAARYYPRINKTWEWDTAAGQAILEAAGGRMISYPSLSKVHYNKENPLNNGFIGFASRDDAKLYISKSPL